MLVCWMLPCLGQEVVYLKAEELSSRSCAAGEVGLREKPPFVGDGCRGEGQEVAGLEVVAL